MEQSQSPFVEFKQQTRQVEYAGFWLRVVAYIIDSMILWLPTSVLPFLFISPGPGLETDTGLQQPPPFFIGLFFGSMLMYVIIYWLYFALMESSAKQATVGKMALKLKVTDMDGNRIGFGQATGRFFGKFVSSIILGIGYLMAGFTEKKQALHDIIADTLVIKKDNDLVIINKEAETY